LISEIDNGNPEVRSVLKELYPYTGNAYVIGVTGAPGVGKSTLVNQMLAHLRKKGKTVGIIAIDPTSPFSGGAILGDRIRMQQHSNDEGVFIRSLATRGHFGGVTHSTRSTIDVLDAMGKEYIIIETVGVGQDEVDIVKSAHTTVIVVIPGMGDDIQAIKAGILEAGDIFVVNKSDRDGADRTISDLNTMIEMGNQGKEKGAWKPVVLKAEAVHDRGVAELIEEINQHRTHLQKAGEDLNLRFKRERVREELAEMVKSRLINDVFKRLIESGEFERSVESIVKGDSNPYTVVDKLILSEPVLSENRYKAD
jgi:LAO/AO transport system kinase